MGNSGCWASARDAGEHQAPAWQGLGQMEGSEPHRLPAAHSLQLWAWTPLPGTHSSQRPSFPAREAGPTLSQVKLQTCAVAL